MRMMTEAMRQSARVSFTKKCQKKIGSLLECWPFMISTHLKSINDLVVAGKEMGVTDADLFTEEEIETISEDLAPLAELEMRTEVFAYLFPVLQAKKLGPEILDRFTAPIGG